jgi:hypothetical protein
MFPKRQKRWERYPLQLFLFHVHGQKDGIIHWLVSAQTAQAAWKSIYTLEPVQGCEIEIGKIFGAKDYEVADRRQFAMHCRICKHEPLLSLCGHLGEGAGNLEPHPGEVDYVTLHCKPAPA